MVNIIDKIAAIRNAVFGIDVRESIASGIESINAEVTITTGRQASVEIRQDIIDTNEATRQSNESARQNNESDRVIVESTRVAEFDGIKTDYNTYKNVMIDASPVANLQNQINAHTSDLADITQLGINAKATPYNAIGDGIADDTMPFTLLESATDKVVFLPIGTYIVNGITLSKKYIGHGKIKLNGVLQANNYVNVQSVPSAGSSNSDYFGGDQSKINAEYFSIASGVPVSTVNSNYYNWELQPHLSNFWVKSGYSGFTTKTTGSNALGQKVVNVRKTTDLSTGMQILIGSDIYTIDTINNIGQFTTTNNLITTYSANTVITKGNRTMFDDYFSNLFHIAGGDAYSYMSRVVGAKAPDADQTHFSWNSTAGIIGGDLTGVEDGVYLTGSEMNFLDENYLGTHDIAVAGDIKSFNRKNDTGARGAVWVGTLYKSEGTKYCEGAHVVTGKWKGGLDFVWADFGANNAAIKLAPNQRIFFDGAGAADEAGYQMWGSNPGDSYLTYSGGLSQMQSVVDGVSALAWTASELYASGNINIPSTFRLNMNGGADDTGIRYSSGQLQLKIAGITGLSVLTDKVYSAGDINVPRDKYLNIDAGGTVTGLKYDGTNIKLYKNGVVVETW